MSINKDPGAHDPSVRLPRLWLKGLWEPCKCPLRVYDQQGSKEPMAWLTPCPQQGCVCPPVSVPSFSPTHVSQMESQSYTQSPLALDTCRSFLRAGAQSGEPYRPLSTKGWGHTAKAGVTVWGVGISLGARDIRSSCPHVGRPGCRWRGRHGSEEQVRIPSGWNSGKPGAMGGQGIMR